MPKKKQQKKKQQQTSQKQPSGKVITKALTNVGKENPATDGLYSTDLSQAYPPTKEHIEQILNLIFPQNLFIIAVAIEKQTKRKTIPKCSFTLKIRDNASINLCSLPVDGSSLLIKWMLSIYQKQHSPDTLLSSVPSEIPIFDPEHFKKTLKRDHPQATDEAINAHTESSLEKMFLKALLGNVNLFATKYGQITVFQIDISQDIVNLTGDFFKISPYLAELIGSFMIFNIYGRSAFFEKILPICQPQLDELYFILQNYLLKYNFVNFFMAPEKGTILNKLLEQLIMITNGGHFNLNYLFIKKKIQDNTYCFELTEPVQKKIRQNSNKLIEYLQNWIPGENDGFSNGLDLLLDTMPIISNQEQAKLLQIKLQMLNTIKVSFGTIIKEINDWLTKNLLRNAAAKSAPEELQAKIELIYSYSQQIVDDIDKTQQKYRAYAVKMDNFFQQHQLAIVQKRGINLERESNTMGFLAFQTKKMILDYAPLLTQSETLLQEWEKKLASTEEELERYRQIAAHKNASRTTTGQSHLECQARLFSNANVEVITFADGFFSTAPPANQGEMIGITNEKAYVLIHSKCDIDTKRAAISQTTTREVDTQGWKRVDIEATCVCIINGKYYLYQITHELKLCNTDRRWFACSIPADHDPSIYLLIPYVELPHGLHDERGVAKLTLLSKPLIFNSFNPCQPEVEERFARIKSNISPA